MAAEETIVKHPVLVLQTLQERTLPERRVACMKLLVRALALIVEGVHPQRQPSSQAKLPTFMVGECGPFVPARLSQNRAAADPDALDLVRGLRELGLGRVAEGANGLPERGYVTQRFGCREGPTWYRAHAQDREKGKDTATRGREGGRWPPK